MICKEILYKKYIEEKKTMKRISSELNIAVGTVYNYIKKYGIISRKTKDMFKGRLVSEETRRKISIKTKGKVISPETREKIANATRGIFRKPTKYGGHSKLRNDGYIKIYKPSHPYATKDGYVMEHILVMENKIGRYIPRDFVVHHKNKIRKDNRIENLELMTFKEHASFHMKERRNKRRNDLLTR